jgi:hypothetical protein
LNGWGKAKWKGSVVSGHERDSYGEERGRLDMICGGSDEDWRPITRQRFRDSDPHFKFTAFHAIVSDSLDRMCNILERTGKFRRM